MTDIKETFDCTGFEWDQSNVDKNLVKHNVTHWECEQVFFNEPLIILDDPTHSVTENRYAAFGQTDDGRLLAVILTKRGELLRVISARDMSRGERKFYEQNK